MSQASDFMYAILDSVADLSPLVQPVAAANLALETAIRHPEWAQAMVAALRASHVVDDGHEVDELRDAITRQVEALIRAVPFGRAESVGFES